METDYEGKLIDFPAQDIDPRDLRIAQLEGERSSLQGQVANLSASLEFLGNTVKVMHKLCLGAA